MAVILLDDSWYVRLHYCIVSYSFIDRVLIGWFILLTSLLGFWRVKRWERNIVASQQPAPSEASHSARFNLERVLGLRGLPSGDFFRQGFGFSTHQDDVEAQTEAEANTREDVDENDLMLNIRPDVPNRAQVAAEYQVTERRLQNDLRAAGFL